MVEDTARPSQTHAEPSDLTIGRAARQPRVRRGDGGREQEHRASAPLRPPLLSNRCCCWVTVMPSINNNTAETSHSEERRAGGNPTPTFLDLSFSPSSAQIMWHNLRFNFRQTRLCTRLLFLFFYFLFFIILLQVPLCASFFISSPLLADSLSALLRHFYCGHPSARAAAACW